jgi:ABC-2 type transport system ATP-binding protein
MSAALSFDAVTKRFGSVTAVDDLSFEVQPGRAVGFLGPNGAGKTTTLRMLLGLATPTRGSALVRGERYATLEAPTRTVGAVLEGSGSHPGRAGRDHLRVLAAAAGLPGSRVEEVLRLVELEDAADRRVKGYSLGMRQRLALAAALLGDPPILILDEPANGLDPAGMRWLRDMLRAEVGQGRTVLISSHVLSEIAQTVDDVVVINRGRLVTQGTLAEVTGGDRGVRVRSADDERLGAELDRRGWAWQRGATGALSVQGATPAEVGEAALAAGVALIELGEAQASLEEAFLDLVGGEAAA